MSFICIDFVEFIALCIVGIVIELKVRQEVSATPMKGLFSISRSDMDPNNALCATLGAVSYNVQTLKINYFNLKSFSV